MLMLQRQLREVQQLSLDLPQKTPEFQQRLRYHQQGVLEFPHQVLVIIYKRSRMHPHRNSVEARFASNNYRLFMSPIR
jgi:hypothetical protein